MKVLIGHSYFLKFDPKLHEAMRPYPPLGTMLAAAQVRDAGHDVVIFDAMLAESTDEWVSMIDSFNPDVAVVFEDNFNYLSKMCLLNMRDAAFVMLGAARDVGCFTAVCGSDATDNVAEFLDAGAGVVISGEGDATLLDLLDHWQHDTTIEAVDGLSFRDGSGTIVTTKDRANMKGLDELPFPARDLVDMDRYQAVWSERHQEFSVNLVTTRGCPYHCNWCAKPIWGQRYNARSPKDVVDEIIELKQAYAPDHLWFADDIVGLKPGWIAEFADLVNEHDVVIPFNALSRPDLMVKGDTAEQFGRAGAAVVWIGAESGSQEILDAMEKGTKVPQIIEAADRVHAAGYKIAFFIQFGYPGEELEHIEETLRLIWRARPDDVGVSVSYPLPGTSFHERVAEQLGDTRNWRDSDDLAMLFEGPYSTEFYRELHQRLHLEYRARRMWWRLRAGQRPSIREAASVIKGAAELPFAKRRVKRLAARNQERMASLPVALSPDAAAIPSSQLLANPTRKDTTQEKI